MVVPETITNYDLNDFQLEEVLLFWVCAAGKNANVAARSLESFLIKSQEDLLIQERQPFRIIRSLSSNKLADMLRICGIGCYNTKSITLWQLAHKGLDLRICSTTELEEIYGIGPKTSRCFILHSRKNARCAGLDVHILKFLSERGIDVPEHTPSGNIKRYMDIERQFLEIADSLKKTPAELDLECWNLYRKGGSYESGEPEVSS